MAQTQSASELSFAVRDIGLGMTLLESFANGIYTMIFVFTLWLLFSGDHTRRYTGCRYMLSIIMSLYVLSIVHLACRWDMIRRSFVLEGATTETILQSLLNQPRWSIVLSTLSLSLMTLIADCVLIWRCWVVWDHDWRAPVLPLLTTIVGTVFCVLSLMHQIKPHDGLYSPSNRTKFTDPGIVYFSLSLASTVFSTLLIIFKIIAISRRTLSMNRYKGVIEVISESAALYAVALLMFLPFFARKDFSQGYAQAILIPITGIAPTIITARVALGLTRERARAQVPSLSVVSWDWASQGSSTTQINVTPCINISSGAFKVSSDKSLV